MDEKLKWALVEIFTAAQTAYDNGPLIARAKGAFRSAGWVKLPSEGELALMLDTVIPEGVFNFSTAAQELLRLLGEVKP